MGNGTLLFSEKGTFEKYYVRHIQILLLHFYNHLSIFAWEELWRTH